MNFKIKRTYEIFEKIIILYYLLCLMLTTFKVISFNSIEYEGSFALLFLIFYIRLLLMVKLVDKDIDKWTAEWTLKRWIFFIINTFFLIFIGIIKKQYINNLLYLGLILLMCNVFYLGGNIIYCYIKKDRRFILQSFYLIYLEVVFVSLLMVKN